MRMSIIVRGGSGDDHLIIDLAEAIRFLKRLIYDGCEDYDVISIKGGSFNKVEYNAINEHSGDIDLMVQSVI